MSGSSENPAERADEVQAWAVLITQEIAAGEHDLAAAVAGLSPLVAGSMHLEDFLTHISEFAVRATPAPRVPG